MAEDTTPEDHLSSPVVALVQNTFDPDRNPDIVTGCGKTSVCGWESGHQNGLQAYDALGSRRKPPNFPDVSNHYLTRLKPS